MRYRIADIKTVGVVQSLRAVDENGTLHSFNVSNKGGYSVCPTRIGSYVKFSFDYSAKICAVVIAESFSLVPDKAVIPILFESILDAIGQLNDSTLYDACGHAVNDPEFLLCAAATSHHNSVTEKLPGGLVAHTAEVIRIMRHLLKLPEFREVDYDVAITAAVFHDTGKVHDYVLSEGSGFFKYTDHGKNIGHLAESYAIWRGWASEYGVQHEKQFEIGHCILASHGRIEWGAIKEPRSKEARLLHQCDMLASQVANVDEFSRTANQEGHLEL